MIVEASIASLKVTVTALFVATLVAPLLGLKPMTVGAVLSTGGVVRERRINPVVRRLVALRREAAGAVSVDASVCQCRQKSGTHRLMQRSQACANSGRWSCDSWPCRSRRR